LSQQEFCFNKSFKRNCTISITPFHELEFLGKECDAKDNPIKLPGSDIKIRLMVFVGVRLRNPGPSAIGRRILNEILSKATTVGLLKG